MTGDKFHNKQIHARVSIFEFSIQNMYNKTCTEHFLNLYCTVSLTSYIVYLIKEQHFLNLTLHAEHFQNQSTLTIMIINRKTRQVWAITIIYRNKQLELK
jgi:riboflavin synthase